MSYQFVSAFAPLYKYKVFILSNECTKIEQIISFHHDKGLEKTTLFNALIPKLHIFKTIITYPWDKKLEITVVFLSLVYGMYAVMIYNVYKCVRFKYQLLFHMSTGHHQK